ncbi:MAG: sigma-70 family RNA polymerase sigma factor [Sedimentisphaerales bacterium]|jgi:RNA polymerase sigma-70 factor (ECF subfamily)|nr:sigma-70 family RNA polymerase sigma factor [Sedimentisphaerales bacterium]HNY77968.1 sigma-70 family RNA polymerase sigma factor [Sedimentisphaerales bacterium]HOC63364.1 sigma-70 family RNA polymerase sigma factor [Sedimentisphaerales bacterium]HOH64106.1 sigma-70 family RNA polymerase sigma factor [Sedimentisphaerales bacterium]HPY48809.1 sigma-70 family RNA polymerase sigma factor [Sedimentisphaerales bacterium]
MFEEKLWLWKLRHGNAEALGRIYDRYKHDMLGLAVSLSADRTAGEDAVHDVFISFVRRAPQLRLKTSLRSYLLSSVANRVRNDRRSARRHPPPAAETEPAVSDSLRPDRIAVQVEQATLIEQAMAQLPYDQQEAVILHLQVGMTFREIAESQGVSINTVQSRYRYGLERLRSLLDGKMTP